MSWIKVSDRLPEVDEYGHSDVVIVCYDDKLVSVATYERDEFGESWHDMEWHVRWQDNRKIEVTHWMPLPEPAND